MLCVFASLSFATFVHAAGPPVPIASFVADSGFGRPELSPDGQHVAVVLSAPYRDRTLPMLTVIKVPDRKTVAQLKLAFLEVPADHHWVSNKRLVLAAGIEAGRYETPFSTGTIFATDIDGKNQKSLYGPGRDLGPSSGLTRDSGDGYFSGRPSVANGHFYLRDDQWEDGRWNSMLFDVDATSGERKRLAKLPLANLSLLQKRSGELAYAYGFDENNVPMLFRHEGKADVRVPLDVDERGELIFPIAFTPDDSAIYAHATVDDGPIFLVRQRADGGDQVVLAKHPVGAIDYTAWSPSPRQPFAAASSIDVPSWNYFDADSPSARLHKSLSAQFPGSFVSFLNYSANGERLLFSVVSDKDPGLYYLWDAPTATATLLFSDLPAIDPERMGERRAIDFKARDGLELHGYLTLPAGVPARNLPLVLLPHGGPHGVNDEWFFDADAQFLASRGYAVMQINYRGSTGRGKIFRKAGLMEWGGKLQDDLIDAVRWTTRSGVADASRVCVYGASFGAFAAMHVVAREPAMFKCAVGLAGLYDLPMYFKEVGESRRGKNILTEYFGDDRKVQERDSPTSFAARIQVPVLLVHGEQDDTAPIAQGEKMVEALRDAKKSVEWVTVPGEGHGFYARKNQEDFYKRLEAFLAKYLKPGS